MAKSKEIILPLNTDIKIATTAVANLLDLDIDARFLYFDSSSGMVKSPRVFAYQGDSIIGFSQHGIPQTFGLPLFQLRDTRDWNGGLIVSMSRRKGIALSAEAIMGEYNRIINSQKS